MKKNTGLKKMALFFLALFCLMTASSVAQAFNLTIQNNYAEDKWFAVLYRDDKAGKWLCSGWYKVPAHMEKDFSFANSDKVKYAYLYSSVFDGEGQADAIKRTVIGGKFSYYDGQQCPQGERRRTESFAKFGMCINGAKLIWGEAEESQTLRKTVNAADEADAVALLNQDRKKQGLRPLTADARLTQTARAHAADMVKNEYFDHVNLAGQSPFDRMTANKIIYRQAGENIGSNNDVQGLEREWMNSPEHRANILNAKYTHVGVGLCADGDGQVYGVQLFAAF